MSKLTAPRHDYREGHANYSEKIPEREMRPNEKNRRNWKKVSRIRFEKIAMTLLNKLRSLNWLFALRYTVSPVSRLGTSNQ
jgi:hypothetical protein